MGTRSFPGTWGRAGWIPALLVLGWALLAWAVRPAGPLPPGPGLLDLGGLSAVAPADVAPHLGVLRDDTGLWTLEDTLRQPERLTAQRRVIADGYQSQRVYWIRLRLRATDTERLQWWLRVERAYLDDVRLWHFEPGGALRGGPWQAGDLVRPSGAQLAPVPAFALDLTAPGEHLVVLRVATGSTAWIPVSLVGQDLVPRRAAMELVPVALLIGASLVVVLMALVAGLWLRERVYLSYAALITTNAVVWACITGWAHVMLFGQEPPWAERTTASAIALSAALGPWLYFRLLGLNRLLPLWSRLLSANALALALLGGGLPWMGFNGRFTEVVLWDLSGCQVLVLLALLVAWRRLEVPSRLLAVAVMSMSLLTAVNSLAALGWVPLLPQAEAAGPLAHLMHLALLVPYLLHETLRERRAAQASDQRAQAAEVENRMREEALEDKTSLVAMLAHEIRTPLAVMEASIQSLALVDDPPPPERAQRYERIGRALRRLSGLVELVVSRNRVDVSQWHHHAEDLDPGELGRRAIDELGDEARARVDMRRPSDLPAVHADGRMLLYVLQNLLDNALKYAPSLTPVVLEVCAEAGPGGGPGVAWRVRDQGPGIRAEDHDRIFQKYYRSGSAPEVPGLGLGLYLVRQIVQRHGGSVRVEPQAGPSGTCMCCWLPLQPLSTPKTP